MSADVGGSWGVVGDPYVPPEQGPIFNLPRCGCVTFGEGPPTSTTASGASEGDVYVDETTETAYQFQDSNWTIFGGGGQQVYKNSGDPNNVVTVTTDKPCFCIDTLNGIVWVKVDSLKTNTGWTSP